MRIFASLLFFLFVVSCFHSQPVVLSVFSLHILRLISLSDYFFFSFAPCRSFVRFSPCSPSIPLYFFISFLVNAGTYLPLFSSPLQCISHTTKRKPPRNSPKSTFVVCRPTEIGKWTAAPRNLRRRSARHDVTICNIVTSIVMVILLQRCRVTSLMMRSRILLTTKILLLLIIVTLRLRLLLLLLPKKNPAVNRRWQRCRCFESALER